MRKVRHILANMDKLKGEYAALTRCVSKQARTNWRRAIEVMEAVQISVLQHVTPSHAELIARGALRERWASWVQECEAEEWTVAELRQQLRGNGKPTPRETEPADETDEYALTVEDVMAQWKHYCDQVGQLVDDTAALRLLTPSDRALLWKTCIEPMVVFLNTLRIGDET